MEKDLTGYEGLLCAVTLQAIEDVHQCDGYSHGVDALLYLNADSVHGLHEMIGINLRRYGRWDFKKVRKLRKPHWHD